jgi:Sigma-70, region 4
LLTDTASDAAQHAETADSLSIAFLVVLESLSPVERAVFLLREVFDYDYREIADIVGKSEANVRQLQARACRYIDRGLDPEDRIVSVVVLDIAGGVVQAVRGSPVRKSSHTLVRSRTLGACCGQAASSQFPHAAAYCRPVHCWRPREDPEHS